MWRNALPTGHSLMIRFLWAFIAGLLVLPCAALLYLWLGYAPVATKAAPLPFEKRITALALNARVSRDARKQAGVPPTQENLMAGAKVYSTYCAVCHGAIGQSKPPIAKGEYPPPPQMFDGKGVTNDPVGATHWQVANGIRLTGMPAFTGTLSDTQMWQVSQLLANGNKLPPAVRQFLAAE
jgi:mono/diheme cytochrome c family protein